MPSINIMGVTIHGLDMVETLCCVDNYIKLGEEAKTTGQGKMLHHIVTLNAEILYRAQTDPILLELINKADLVTPDGSGIVWACRELAGADLKRVTGIDLMMEICYQAGKNHWGVFLFGAKPGVADVAAQRLEEIYDTDVTGMAHGYFAPEDEEAILERINAAQPQVLFVALGAPRQEMWIDKYRDRLRVPVVVGVGGSFDVIAGNVKRAPKFFQKTGMEWLWRLLKEPWRWKRMLSLPKFMLLVKKIKRKQNMPKE
ncbi:MAG: WecB/TagA/CpsF family glycosyltransferase [Clostridia bacterium]|nr:WecB/TagA/CpsF family glycosyltransferase [Clostridia bacterium]